jgi:poly-beta-1,6-N-acetyl-D-glucosamine N-deacetylase
MKIYLQAHSHLLLLWFATTRTARRLLGCCLVLLMVAVPNLALSAPIAVPVAAPSETPIAKSAKNDFRVLCYHDIRDNLRESLEKSPESTAISTRELVEQFDWLRRNGYNVISLQQVVDARAGGAALPDKAVLLTFDDGYRSTYTHVYPLLKTYGFPAVVGLVEQFLTPDANGNVVYDEKPMQRRAFLTWPEIREMAKSGLVEFASHTAFSHKGVLANPQGNMQPALVTHIYDPKTGTYESETAYADRLYNDFKSVSTLMEKEIGVKPRAIIWPYGAFNATVVKAAERAGHTVAFDLTNDGHNAVLPLMGLSRELVTFTATTRSLYQVLDDGARAKRVSEIRKRVMHVDLDYVYDADPLQQEKNLGHLIERVRELGVSHVYLQAFADPDGKGVASALYFPNRHLPMRADLYNRAAWQLRTRGGVKVYAWLPVLGFALSSSQPAANDKVEIDRAAPSGHAKDRYVRLSPYSPRARQVIREIYEDLGKHAWGTRGILFHDDATLDDFEDASEMAVATYVNAGLPKDLAAIRNDVQHAKLWTKLKTRTLTDFTLELANTLRAYIPELETARNIYASVVLDPKASAWFAQDLDDMLEHYNYTAVMAMPYMEKAKQPTQWLQTLAQQVLQRSNGPERAVFELQSKDWRQGVPIDSDLLAEHTMVLRRAGVRHIGYYPDDLARNLPSIEILKPAFSLSTFPVRR